MTLGFVESDGCRLRYEVTGAGETTLLLVHGASAHRLWWHRMAPALAQHFRVITMDLSGHGDSGYRAAYGPRVYAEDINAVAEQVGQGPVTLVAHSMGGRCAVVAAARHPGNFSRLVILDAGFPADRIRAERPRAARIRSTYPDLASIRAGFRLMPRQPAPAPDVLDPVFDYAVRRTESGWTWKFDPGTLWRYDDELVDACLARVRCPITYAYGTRSLLPVVQSAERILALYPDATIRPIEGARHHVPLDAPEQCVAIVTESCAEGARAR
ncbi:MAG TPA: alpha/beta hydrolase [Amycolatopsis sp.]|nr:alpha/beta hydrolase [Amycolatopsis sp.]